jgi:hypothetical protein
LFSSSSLLAEGDKCISPSFRPYQLLPKCTINPRYANADSARGVMFAADRAVEALRTSQNGHLTASATNSQPAAKSESAGTKSTQAQSSRGARRIIVQISNAAKSTSPEASETRFQTSQEASKGDQQAQKLLAEQAAGQNR